MKTIVVDLMVDRNLRFKILEEEITSLLTADMPADKKVAVLKQKIAELSNRVYAQDMYVAKTLSSRYRKP